MTLSHYSAEENNTQSKLAIMMALPSAISPKNNEIIQVTDAWILKRQIVK